MKKITLLFLLMTTVLAFGQAPTTDPPTPPTRNASDVISIFSGAYTDVSGTNFNPNWNQAGFGNANTSLNTGSGNIVLAYPNFNYQGNEFGSSQDISTMEKLHVDIWINGTFNPRVFVISSGTEIPHVITNTGSGAWISVDINVAGITGDLTKAIQFKFDGGNGTTDAIYVDNLYFWKNPTTTSNDATLSDLKVNGTTISGFASTKISYTYTVASGAAIPTVSATTTQSGANANITQATAVPGNATVVVTAQDGTTMKTYTVSYVNPPLVPTTAPTAPTASSGNVTSLYSDAYTDVASSTTPGWSEVVAQEMHASNNVYKTTNFLPFALTNPIDITSRTTLHVDVWLPTLPSAGAGLLIKLLDTSGTPDNEAHYTHSKANMTAGSWNSIDIPISSFTQVKGTWDAAARGKINQVLVDIVDDATMYVDNVYFYTGSTASTNTEDLIQTRIFPNPSGSVWNVSTPNAIIKSVEVYNVLGRRVMVQDANSDQVSISAEGLASGLYLTKITTDKGTKTVRLVRE